MFRGIGHLLYEEFEHKIPIRAMNNYFLNFNKEEKIKLLDGMDKKEDVRNSFYRVNNGTEKISLDWFNDYIGNVINIIPEIKSMDISDENKLIACDIVTNEVEFFKRCEVIFPDIPNSLLSFFSVVGRELQAYTLRSIEYYFKNNRQKINFSNYNKINSMYDLDYAVMGCFFDGIATADKDLQIIYNQMNNGKNLI